MWDVQSHSITRRSRNYLESESLKMIWKVGVCHRPQKQKKYCIFCTNNFSKIRTYEVLNTLPGDCDFEISGLGYFERLSLKGNA